MANGVPSISGELSGYPFGPGANPYGEDRRDNLITTTIRERWWLLAIFAVVSAAVAYPISGQFRRQTAKVSTTLMFEGLPTSTVGGSLHSPQTMTTYSQLFTSREQMQTLQDQFGLAMPPDEQQLQVTVRHGSSLMDVTFTASDARQAVDLVNTAAQNFIDSVAARRVEVIQQKLRHVESSLLGATSELEQKQRVFDEKSGLLTTEDIESLERLKQSIQSLSSTLDQRNANFIARDFQLQQMRAKQQETIIFIKDHTLSRAKEEIGKAQERTAPSSSRFKELTDTQKQLEQAHSEAEIAAVLDWQMLVREICGDRFSVAVFQSPELMSAAGQMTKLTATSESIEMDVQLAQKEIEQLTTKLDEYQSEYDQLFAKQNSLVDAPRKRAYGTEDQRGNITAKKG